MGVKLKREKPRQLLLSILYRLSKLPIASPKAKVKLFLNLEWLFDRLVHENSFKIFPDEVHPVRTCTKDFLAKHIRPTDRVVDLGSDEGVMSNYLADMSAEVVGIDNNAPAVVIAQQRYSKPNLTFINQDALDYLGNNNRQFDVLILSHILEHLDQPDIFLKSYLSHFKYVFIEVPDFDKGYLYHYRQRLNMDLVYTDNDHVTEFDRQELIETVEKSGLKILESEFRHGVQRLWCSVQ